MNRTGATAGDRNVLSDEIITSVERDPTTRLPDDILTAEKRADDPTSQTFVDVDAPSARNGDGPGGKDNGS